MCVRDIHMNILVLNGYENSLEGISYGHLHSLSLYSFPIVTSSNDPFNNFPIISSMNSLTFSRWCPVIVDASVPVVPDEHSLELRNLRFNWCRSHSPAFCCMTLQRLQKNFPLKVCLRCAANNNERYFSKKIPTDYHDRACIPIHSVMQSNQSISVDDMPVDHNPCRLQNCSHSLAIGEED